MSLGATTLERSFVKVPPRTSPVWKTPMFEQYWRIKDGIQDALLFYRMGDFYELFGEDAVIAAPLLEVQLTARDKEAEIPIPMCGVPFHAWDSYAERILSKGLKIALCEQLTEPGKSKLVERGVVRILTPGLPVDFKKLDAKAPHFFASVSASAKGTQICLLDFLAGQYFCGLVESPEQLKDIFLKTDPKEILIPADQHRNESLKSQWFFLETQNVFYKRMTPWAGKEAEKNLYEYLVYTQRTKDGDIKKYLPEPRPLKDLTGQASSEYAAIPANVLEQWDLFPSLFELLDGCGSALGSRRLRALLGTPLKNSDRIRLRQKFFSELSPLSKSLLEISRDVYDVERILGRFRIGAADPKELLRFLRSFEAVFKVFELLGIGKGRLGSSAFQELLSREHISLSLKTLETLEALLQELRQKLNLEVDPSRIQSLAELLKEGFDRELDELKFKASNSQKWLEDFEENLKKTTEINTLKLRFNRVFGYYIEVTKTQLSKVPKYFERKQTTVNGERFTCEELRSKESEILSAQSKSEAKAKELLREMESHILNHALEIGAALDAFSWMDAVAGVLTKVEKLKRWGQWTYPEIKSGPFYFEVEDLRHPILEDLLQGSFVPSTLSMQDKRVLLLTGPNMAGKSTLMRELGLGLYLAQCGLPVPATKMVLCPASGFYSRMGATDNILEGESTFMVEMKETARILAEADANSFVLIDEIGRGTSTQDGLAIAQAVLEHLAEKVGAICLFATHYHELSEWASRFRTVQNASMAIQVSKGELHFLRSLEFRPAESSYGIFVARLAGLPKALLARAEKYFSGYEATVEMDRHQLDIFSMAPLNFSRDSKDGVNVGNSRLENGSNENAADEDANGYEEVEQALVTSRKIIQRLHEIDLNDLSPKQAWEFLENLKSENKD